MSEETSEVVSTGTEIGNAESSPQVETKDVAPSTDKPQPEVAAEKLEYTPNYKFKYLGMDEKLGKESQVEKEFDEFVRSGIKDVESEKKVRELYEKAYGLDLIKPKHEEAKKRASEYEGNYNQLNTAVNEVLDLGSKDETFGMFIERLKIPEERVAKWMLERIKKMELPPDQKAMYDNFEETKRQNLLLQKQFQELNGQTQAQAVQARTMELESGLRQQDVSSFASSFDAARKTPGAFKQEVQEQGLYEWKINGKDISAQEAIQRVMSRYSGFVSPTAIGSDPAQPAVEKQLPVIPRLQGKAVSATGKQVRSIADLKKKAEELAG